MPGRTKPGVVRKMKVDEVGLVATSFAGKFESPCHLALDKLGNIFSSDASSETLRVYRGQDGRLLTRVDLGESLEDQPLSTVKCVQGLVLDEEENIYVVDGFNHRILLLRNDGSLIRILGHRQDGSQIFCFPRGIDLGDQGYIYVADAGNKRVVVMERDGNFVKAIQSPQEMCNPCAVCWGKGGVVYVADAGISSIFAFDVDGELINQFDGSNREYDGAQVGENKLVCPLAITQGSDGCLYVCDGGAHDIKIFTSQGQFVRKIGSAGRGEGQFFRPTDIKVDAIGNLVVADFYNNRIQILAAVD